MPWRSEMDDGCELIEGSGENGGWRLELEGGMCWWREGGGALCVLGRGFNIAFGIHFLCVCKELT